AAVGHVVAGVGAAEAQPRGGNGLDRSHVLIREGGTAADVADVIGAEHAAERAVRDGGGGGPVIHLVGRGDAPGEGQRRDVGGRGGAGVDGVIARIGARQIQAGGRNGLAVAHVFVGEGGAAADVADVVHTEDATQSAVGDGRGGGRIIHLVG